MMALADRAYGEPEGLMVLSYAGAPPGAGGASGPRPPRRGTRRRAFLVVVLVAALVALLAVGVNTHTVVSGQPVNGQLLDRAYGPQPGRTAEWVGDPEGQLSQAGIDAVARNTGIEILPKFADNFSVAGHFADARRLVEAAKKYGNDLKVFDYFSASFWFEVNSQQWGTYGQQFQSSWLLRDHNGQTIPFYGIRRTAQTGSDPVGHLIDLRNPDYRAWAVRTIVAWMKSAPYAGITFDSSNPLLDSASVRAALGNGDAETYSELLCGQTTACTAVDDWNTGLSELLSSTRSALHAMGKEVLYNGISPSPQHSADRNTALLADTDAASNEEFCASVNGNGVEWTSIPDDVALMKRIASEHKKVVEITNYKTSANEDRLGGYCLAGFLMGWQPGSSYYVSHASYKDVPTGTYPHVPEQNLQLGDPTAQSVTHGALLTRTFHNGFVALNSGDSPAQVRIPVAGTEFADGVSGDRLAAGATRTLKPHTALFLLSSAYLNG